jgi:hypothetical protein
MAIGSGRLIGPRHPLALDADLGTPPEGGYWLMTACRKS